jgi:hypothetical protein
VIGRPERVIVKMDPYADAETDFMEFRLTYDGLLLGGASKHKVEHKHSIRKRFQKQLRRLVVQHPAFESFRFVVTGEDPMLNSDLERYKSITRNFSRFGFDFFPIVLDAASLTCTVNILFLRPDRPGAAMNGNDLDGRMKTIFDALKTPKYAEELKGQSPDADETPFFCLLEDDSLIDHVEVETDTLLEPTPENAGANDARLIIRVRLSPYRVTMENLSFAG